VILIDQHGKTLGQAGTARALALAREQGLDLVVMTPKDAAEDATPVCRLMPPSDEEPALADEEGKKFHDPLAACCAIDESIGIWAEVELYREKGGWGSRLSPGSGVWIITGYDREKFLKTLTAFP
jgi:hypothetical protein